MAYKRSLMRQNLQIMTLGFPTSGHQDEILESTNEICSPLGPNCRTRGHLVIRSGSVELLTHIRRKNYHISLGWLGGSSRKPSWIEWLGLRSHKIEPNRGHREWVSTPAQTSTCFNRQRIRDARGKYMRQRGGTGKRTFAHLLYTGGLSRAQSSGPPKILNLKLIYAGAFFLELSVRANFGGSKLLAFQRGRLTQRSLAGGSEGLYARK